MAAIDKGGYPEALARVAFLMAHKDEPLPLSRLQLAHDLLDEYRDFLPELPTRRGATHRRRAGNHRSLRAGQGGRRRYPSSLRNPKDRERLLTLLDRVLADKRVQRIQPSPEQTAMLARIRQVLTSQPGGKRANARWQRIG